MSPLASSGSVGPFNRKSSLNLLPNPLVPKKVDTIADGRLVGTFGYPDPRRWWNVMTT